ncbi:hypothetical protein [Dyadobacter sp. CY323]|uniref:hypothetical protein n=1 Tax=Dyadobacter sp. CY323 TaxID=2907302 RepID=UPI001F3B0B31|nr:hypothetical protein [Dyadobacter sp. CY323]MCE6989728.1 hypothetical protein [Dyadobacter sp. CY323]
MQKISLLSGYDSATLFDKIRRKSAGEINQWPEAYFAADQISGRLNDIFDHHRPRLPEIDWDGGKESINEKICLLSSFQPGAKPGANVRVNVLTYEYPFQGEIYLLGCHPAQLVPESPGECFVDPVRQVIAIEYTGFNKSPRQVLTMHRSYLSTLIASYLELKNEFDAFNSELPGFLHKIVEKRKQSIEDMSRILSAMQKWS